MKLADVFLTTPLAHRALHDVADGRPENSRAAIKAAVKAGYGIEIDVQRSHDEAAMVFHDYDMRRLTGEGGPIAQRTAADLGAVILTGGDGGIPTLDEVLELVAGRVPLLIEIKDQDGAMGPNVGPLEAATAQAIEGYVGPLAVMSFNPHAVAEFGRLAPNVPRGLVTSSYDVADFAPVPASVCDHLRDIPDYERVGACFISHEATDLSRPRVAELKAKGADILCWTIRSQAEEDSARKVAQNITFEGYLAALSS